MRRVSVAVLGMRSVEMADAVPGGLGHANVGRTLGMHIAGHAEFSPAEDPSQWSASASIPCPAPLSPHSDSAKGPSRRMADRPCPGVSTGGFQPLVRRAQGRPCPLFGGFSRKEGVHIYPL